MTKSSWQPDLTAFKGPRYLALASAVESDITAGRLKPGERLPTHRDLAWHLGVTVGTVSRGYAEALRRGLLTGEVGRGTFVRGDVVPSFNSVTLNPIPIRGGNEAGLINMGANVPPITEQTHLFREMLRELADDEDLDRQLIYPPYVGSGPARLAAAQWLSDTAFPVSPEEIFITSGCQHALMVTFHLMARPGDTVLVERLTYPGLKSLAHMMQVRLVGVDMDDDGILPDALDAACRGHAPKLLCIVPTMQNPRNIVMSDERRRAISLPSPTVTSCRSWKTASITSWKSTNQRRSRPTQRPRASLSRASRRMSRRRCAPACWSPTAAIRKRSSA